VRRFGEIDAPAAVEQLDAELASSPRTALLRWAGSRAAPGGGREAADRGDGVERAHGCQRMM
jgi:hypothetical protein